MNPSIPSIKTLKRSPPMASSSPHCNPSLAQMAQDQITSVLLLLPPDSILSFSMTCRRFRSIASADSLWESVCRREWGSACVDAIRGERRRLLPSWKALYREVSQLSAVSCRRLPSRDGVGPRPRASHSLNFVSDCLVLFGGGCEGGSHLQDTWVAYIGNGVGTALSWQQVNSGIPSGRFGQSCTVVNDALILFGGINDNGDRQNDTWIGRVLREGPLETTIQWKLLDAGSIMPSPRGAHAACYASDSQVVIHGGIGLSGLRLGDTWLLDLSDGPRPARWHQIRDVKPYPPARSGHSLTWIGDSRMVLFGGRGSGYEVLNDVWLLDMGGGSPEWKELKYDSSSVPGDMPLPRAGHSATLILGGWVLIYGGEDSQRHRKDDFWVLDIGAFLRLQLVSVKKTSRKMWKKINAEGQSPSYRSFHGACTDNSGCYIFVSGGMVDGVLRPAEFRFDGELHLVELMLQS